jgi:uncharacterized FlaG/YvyC family protein
MKYFRFRGRFSKPAQTSEERVKALQERYWRELASTAEDINEQFNEYVESLRSSVEDCIKKYCVLNELFERKMAIRINGGMSILGDKLVERFKELESEREKEERRQQRKREREEKRHGYR